MPRNFDTEPDVVPTNVPLSSFTVGPVALAVGAVTVRPASRARRTAAARRKRDIVGPDGSGEGGPRDATRADLVCVHLANVQYKYELREEG